MPERFNLSAEDAVEQARQQIELHEGEERGQLRGLDADIAFELGYRSALYDIDRYRGEDPFTVDLVTFDIPIEEPTDD